MARAAPLAALAALLAFVPAALGHGLMIHPKSRNFVAYLNNQEYNAHSLNMGGAWVVSDYGKLTYPWGNRGACGDKADQYKWDAPGTPQITYIPGQEINIDAVIAVNHMGKITAEICDLYAKPGDGKCQKLKVKMDNGQTAESWWLPGINQWGGGNYGGEGPRYGDGTFEAYQLPEITESSGWGCNGQRLCNMYKDMYVYRTKWLLPQGFTCDHCKLQWTWTTGHSCWPTCEEGNPMPQCGVKQQFGACGSAGTAYPEEFVNCADVKITDAAKLDWASNFPPWNGWVEGNMKKGWWGSVSPSIMNSGY
ncbi:hypothetical protein Rsub_08164 [Raphidocelis subcapitata]|uniref:Chitin-binding type-4 domain-containing protein n=1 Tax=Raphidocelis subcapitata TaxID=307507 RepID=A0A2V0P4W3_9CHLO|nr:hypothetical protein Rsub_08164 [Raphidocelis subcapitata]|eukprot:GBF94921.1 hypothetical protein Rsub_08164 [Raphidocelis subcapitata]